ncbi:MAG: leucine-rich repeat protein [Clostridiales bacterium]
MMKKLIAGLLAVMMVCSMAAVSLFAATGVSDFTDEDYVYMHPNDYYAMRDKSINFKGVAWEEGAKVIYGETNAYGGIPGAKGNGVWFGSPNVDTSVTSIKFPTSVVILGFQLFEGRDQITSVNFEELANLRHIGTGAFSRVQLSAVDLSNTKVISIDNGAFMTGTRPSIRRFKAPATLKRIGAHAFANQTWLNGIELNEGLEIIEEGALAASGGFIIPSTVKEIGKNALNPERTYQVYRGSYAEQYCKDNKLKFFYTDGTSPGAPAAPAPAEPVTPPATSFPPMNYTKTLGPVTFSNYVSHQEVTPLDANGQNVNVTWVKIGDKGSMRADKDNTEFTYWWGGSGGWNANKNSEHKNDITTDSGAWNGDWRTETLQMWNITPYATTKSNNTWSKGLTWQFNYNAQYTNQNSFNITVEVDGQKYYYAVSVRKEGPAAIPVSELPKTATAVPTNSKVYVNGKAVNFDAYNINSNNYFKLRDVAHVVSGSAKQFNVTWNTETGIISLDPNIKSTVGAIELISNTPYVSAGGELAAGDGKTKPCTLNTSRIMKDGRDIKLAAYTINGNNYFKLRDLGETFNFNVGWDSANNAITIDTMKGYTVD